MIAPSFIIYDFIASVRIMFRFGSSVILPEVPGIEIGIAIGIDIET